MNNSTFLIEMGKRISGRRKELHWSQEKLAEATQLSVQSISSLELGKKRIRPENLSNMANVLSVSADYLLTGKKSKSQLTRIERKLSTLSLEDYKMVELLIDHLNKKHQ